MQAGSDFLLAHVLCSVASAQLCAKEIDIKVAEKLDKKALEFICKLEMLLPPGFFNLMQHMILHLAYEVLKGGGAVQFCWQFGPERVNKDL
jgi:hypothetical protein